MLRIEKDTEDLPHEKNGAGLRYALGIATALVLFALVALAYGISG
ncbi:hypothetical protein [Parvibaculum sp.]|nr:hypothetical protein [Parvibaculum sp.]|tara:strand:- start:116 stop:250 length:135 start_codon:yes stop_codon:yes gene_type:complete